MDCLSRNWSNAMMLKFLGCGSHHITKFIRGLRRKFFVLHEGMRRMIRGNIYYSHIQNYISICIFAIKAGPPDIVDGFFFILPFEITSLLLRVYNSKTILYNIEFCWNLFPIYCIRHPPSLNILFFPIYVFFLLFVLYTILSQHSGTMKRWDTQNT